MLTNIEPQSRCSERLRLCMEHSVSDLGLTEHHAVAYGVQVPAELVELSNGVVWGGGGSVSVGGWVYC
jgi:hypothetical protein